MSTINFLAPALLNDYWIPLLAIVLAFVVSVRIYPVIIYTVRTKNLMDEPEHRSTHVHKTPTLGGVGVFATFTVSILLYGMFADLVKADLNTILAIVGATIILLFLGIKDDLIALAPRKKFIGQLAAIAIVILATDIRIHSFYGVLGIGELPYLVSVLFTLLIYIFLINAYNLIDGIDGLAGFVAILANVVFGIYFFVNDDKLMVMMSAVLIGALIGFLSYNLSDTRKLFLGDSGSMFVGFLLAFEAVYLIQFNYLETTIHPVSNAPIFVMAALSYPIVDCIRIFSVRIAQKKSPFMPDRNHIHHRLLDTGLTHKQATISLTLTAIFVMLFTFMAGSLYINLQFYILIVASCFAYLSLSYVMGQAKITPKPTPQVTFGKKKVKGIRIEHKLDMDDKETVNEEHEPLAPASSRFFKPTSEVTDFKTTTQQEDSLFLRGWREIRKYTAF